MKRQIYIVIAYRWGENSNHSYTVASFNRKHAAIKCADSHTSYRGGKYACAVEASILDDFNNDADFYIKEVYRTRSAMCKNSE